MNKFNSQLLKVALPLTLVTAGLTMSAQDVSEAEILLKTGEPQRAISILEQMSVGAKDSKIPMLMGECYVAMDSIPQAIKCFREAQKKGNNDAWLSLAKLAILQYRIEDAEEDLELYRKGLKKGKKTLPDNSKEIESMLGRTRNMLDRVEKITILDSISVDADDFFKFYPLTDDCGHLSAPTALPSGLSAAIPSVVYTSPDKSEMIWATADSAMNVGLVSSYQLYGGEWESPTPLGAQLNGGGDANYPFLMNDGITLYFANDGDDSLGGYDIFITRRNSDGQFFQPQNLGMPYNSPYNDYMLAIDEQTGIGWWATDRNRIPGKVTIYTFIPSEVRENYSVDNPLLASFARIDSYKNTWTDEALNTRILMDLKRSSTGSGESYSEPEFSLSVPGRGIYTSFKQFRNQEAANIMHRYLKRVEYLEDVQQQLALLRNSFSAGDSGKANEIIKLEKETVQLNNELKSLRNQVIIKETK